MKSSFEFTVKEGDTMRQVLVRKESVGRFIALLLVFVMGCALLAACNPTAPAEQTDSSSEMSEADGGSTTDTGDAITVTTTTTQLSASIPVGWGGEVVEDDKPIGSTCVVTTAAQATANGTSSTTTSSLPAPPSDNSSAVSATTATTMGEYFPGVW